VKNPGYKRDPTLTPMTVERVPDAGDRAFATVRFLTAMPLVLRLDFPCPLADVQNHQRRPNTQCRDYRNFEEQRPHRTPIPTLPPSLANLFARGIFTFLDLFVFFPIALIPLGHTRWQSRQIFSGQWPWSRWRLRLRWTVRGREIGRWNHERILATRAGEGTTSYGIRGIVILEARWADETHRQTPKDWQSVDRGQL